MILARLRTAFVLGLAALCVTPAHADVLEINGSDARWIAGPMASEDTDPLSRTDAEFPPWWPEEADGPMENALIPANAIAGSYQYAAAIPASYTAKVAELSARFDLSPALIEALVWQESRWRADAVSPAGARGLAQLMPGTAREMGVDPDDPFANLEGGARYLREQIDRFGGNLEKALAAYNAGPGRVIQAGGIPRIRETQTYVAAIMGRLSHHSSDNPISFE